MSENEEREPTRDELRAWWHEVLDDLMEQGYTPVSFVMDNPWKNRVSISYMPPDVIAERAWASQDRRT